MATSKPRITISLKPNEYETLKRLAIAQRKPMATVLTDLMGGLMPVIEQLAGALEYVQQTDDESREQLRGSVQKLSDELEPLQASALLKFGKIAQGDHGEG